MPHASIDSLAGGALVVDLASLALIEVRGAEAESFLQGQFSNDVAALADSLDASGARRSQLHAYCNPKGRALALLRLVRYPDRFVMLVPTALAEGLVKRLKMFVLRAKVEIEARPSVLLGWIAGDDRSDNMTINMNMFDAFGDNLDRIAVDGIRPRQIFIGDAELASRVRDIAPTDDMWRLLDIHSGIAQIYPQTAEAFIPQMLNLDIVDGLSFSKGCYPGQEIIARLRYLGKVKQRMVAGIACELASIAPGDPLYTQRGGQKAGLVVDAVQTAAREYTFSVTAPVQSDDLLVGRASADPAEYATVTRIALPYAAQVQAQAQAQAQAKPD